MAKTAVGFIFALCVFAANSGLSQAQSNTVCAASQVGKPVVGNPGDRVYLVPKLTVLVHWTGGERLYVFDLADVKLTGEGDELVVEQPHKSPLVLPSNAEVHSFVNVCVAPPDAALPSYLMNVTPTYTMPG
jgi:hypothetical protein